MQELWDFIRALAPWTLTNSCDMNWRHFPYLPQFPHFPVHLSIFADITVGYGIICVLCLANHMVYYVYLQIRRGQYQGSYPSQPLVMY